MPRIRSALLLLCVPISIASATGPNSLRPRTVDWSEVLFVPAYEPGPGGPDAPAAVVLRYQRWTSARGDAENMDASPCGVIFTHEVHLELGFEGGRTLDLSSRMGTDSRMLGGFDGSVDFSGGSGVALWSSEAATTVLVLDEPEDIAWFTGPSRETRLRLTATGEAGFVGPGTLHQEVEVRAGARVTVEYLGS